MINNSEMIHDNELVDEYVAKLRRLVKQNKPGLLVDALKDERYPRTLINLRGKENEYIKLLWELFSQLLHNFSTQELLKIFHEKHVSEIVFIQMMTIFYRMRVKAMHDEIYDLMIDHSELFKNKAIVAEAMHAQASWENAITGDYKKALALNKKALAICRKNGLKLLETKILFGLTHNKSLESSIHLKISKQIEDYRLYYKKFLALHDEYHALRALIEYYSLRLKVCQQNTKKHQAEIESIYQELLKLLQVQKKVKNYYLIMFIKRQISQALMALGQEKKAKQYEKEYLSLKRSFSV